MSINKDNLPIGFNKKIAIFGIDDFLKTVEKNFFSTVTIRNNSVSSTEINLVIELDCNFNLFEVLKHFSEGIWGNFSSKIQSFEKAIQKLQDCNSIPIEIDEFSLFFKNTSLIVTRIYSQSIPEQLENIFKEISNNQIHFTKGLYEVPYEIYVPVYEDNVLENENIPSSILGSVCKPKQDYFTFWGLYFYSEDDAVVYDVKNQNIIKATIQMLNR